MADFRAAEEHWLQGGSEAGGEAEEIERDSGGPISPLIERQEPAGDRHADEQWHQEEHEPEAQLARGGVSSGQDQRHQVHDQEHDQQLGGEMVEAAQEPAEVNLVFEVEDAFPGGLRAGAVTDPEEKAGDHLGGKNQGEQGSPDMPPARATRNGLKQYADGSGDESGSLVQPLEQPRDHTGILRDDPVRKFWKRTQTSRSRTWISSESMSRGLGLFGCEMRPARSKLLL